MNETIKKALNEQVSVPVVIAGKAFGLSRNSAYAAVRNGQLPSVRIGARIAVPTAPLRRMLGLEHHQPEPGCDGF
jgi:hypothetical protein